MSDLTDRLRGRYTVPVNDGAGPLNGKDTFTRGFPVPPICIEAADRIEKLERKLKLMHDATIALRNGMGGHDHWDATMGHGSGCPACIRQREAKDEAMRLIDEAIRP